MWIFATSPDRSIHNPRRNSLEPKHYIKDYSSATVVMNKFLNPLAFTAHQTPMWHPIPWTVMSVSAKPSSFPLETSGNPSVLNTPLSGQRSFTGCDLICLANTLRLNANCWRGCQRGTPGELWQHWNCVPFCSQFLCPGRLLHIVSAEGVQWRFAFVFGSTRISSNSSMALPWMTSMYGPSCLCSTNSLSFDASF